MSYAELDRVRVIERRLTQREAGRILGLTSRQVRRLRRGYERDGARALGSKHRGRPSNRRLPAALRREALATLRCRYEGFGPTLSLQLRQLLVGPVSAGPCHLEVDRCWRYNVKALTWVSWENRSEPPSTSTRRSTEHSD